MHSNSSEITLLRDAFNLKALDEGDFYVYDHDERYYLVLTACEHLQINTVKKSSCIKIPVDEWKRVMSLSEEASFGQDQVFSEPAQTYQEVEPLTPELSFAGGTSLAFANQEISSLSVDVELAAAVNDSFQKSAEQSDYEALSDSPLMSAVTDDLTMSETNFETPATLMNMPEPASFWQPDVSEVLKDTHADVDENAAQNTFEPPAELIMVEPPKPEQSLEEKQENSLRLREKSLQAREAALVHREKAVMERENALAKQEAAIEAHLSSIASRKEAFETQQAQLENYLSSLLARQSALQKQEQHIANIRAYIATSLKKIS